MKIKLSQSLFLCVLITFVAACSKPLAEGKVSKDVRYISGKFDTNKEEAFYAVRWALKTRGYPIAHENQNEGVVKSTWVPTKSDSHALILFDRPDFGVNGGYYQVLVNVTPEEGKMKIAVATQVKAVPYGVKSTGIEERRILNEIGDYLRVKEPEVSNIGLEE